LISSFIRNLLYREEYEGRELSLIAPNLREDDSVLELGAGIGFLSTWCAQQLGSERVTAVEADPYLIPFILETYGRNNVSPRLLNGILAEQDGEAQFFRGDEFWASSTIRQRPKSITLSVRSYAAGPLLLELRPTFLVMDIEGGERETVPLLDYGSIKKAVVEVHPNIIGGEAVTDVIEHLDGEGLVLSERVESTRTNVLYFERP
jgi:FkbM family methyltransferase